MKKEEKFEYKNNRNGIVITGEVLVDVITEGHKKITLFGGSPANIATNLVHMGVKNVTLHASVGQDEYGKYIFDSLKRSNIDISNINLSESKTSFVQINKTTGTPTPTFNREADYEIKLTAELKDKLVQSKIFHFSYWPLSSKKSFEVIKEMINLAKNSGVLIGFDPNYHEELLIDGATIEDIVNLLPSIDIMKPSLDDAIRLFGKGLTHIEYLDKFVSMGVKIVVMTLGRDGLIANINGVIIKQNTLAKDIVDATGAGDAFYSGLYAGILSNLETETILTLGSLCSSYNLKVVGGIANLPSMEDLLDEIKRSK